MLRDLNRPNDFAAEPLWQTGAATVSRSMNREIYTCTHAHTYSHTHTHTHTQYIHINIYIHLQLQLHHHI